MLGDVRRLDFPLPSLPSTNWSSDQGELLLRNSLFLAVHNIVGKTVLGYHSYLTEYLSIVDGLKDGFFSRKLPN